MDIRGFGLLLALSFGLFAGSSSACYPGERTAIEGSCKNYMECSKSGVMVLQSCGISKLFDASKLACDWSWRVNCVDASRECEDAKVYPHPDSCRLYYSCTAGRLALQFCPIMEVFDPATGQCKFGWGCTKSECTASERRAVAGDCSGYQLCENGVWTNHSCFIGYHFDANTEECRMGGCSQCAEGDRSRGSACNRYQECSLGRWTEKKCSVFHRFDPDKKECVWFFNYRCPKELGMKLTAACRDGDVRAEADCTKYGLCTGGSWEVVSCPDGFLFDVSRLECLRDGDAKCLSCPGDVADEETCGAYYSCEGNNKVKKTCGFMKSWDGVSKKCVYWGANCFPGDACSENGKKIPTGDCKFYDECIGGNYYRKACGFSKVYDAKREECVWSWPWNECQNDVQGKECVDGETKTLTCDKYVECVQGRWKLANCRPGETFSNGRCVVGECHVEVKGCRAYSINGVDLECEDDEVFDVRKKECVVGSCQRTRRDVSACQDGDVQALKGSCKRYKVCVNGEFVLKSCSDCMNFDPTQMKCRNVWSYPCEGEEPTVGPPTDPTEAPTEAPTRPTEAPTRPTEAPTRPTEAPTRPTEAPTHPTEAPTRPTEAPTRPTEAPTRPTEAPTEGPTHPTEAPTEPPTHPTEAPTEPPTPSTEAPTQPTTDKPCKEGEKKPNREDCTKYFVCKDGQFVPDSCFWFRKFDSVDLTCKFSGAICAQ